MSHTSPTGTSVFRIFKKIDNEQHHHCTRFKQPKHVENYLAFDCDLSSPGMRMDLAKAMVRDTLIDIACVNKAKNHIGWLFMNNMEKLKTSYKPAPLKSGVIFYVYFYIPVPHGAEDGTAPRIQQIKTFDIYYSPLDLSDRCIENIKKILRDQDIPVHHRYVNEPKKVASNAITAVSQVTELED